MYSTFLMCRASSRLVSFRFIVLRCLDFVLLLFFFLLLVETFGCKLVNLDGLEEKSFHRVVVVYQWSTALNGFDRSSFSHRPNLSIRNPDAAVIFRSISLGKCTVCQILLLAILADRTILESYDASPRRYDYLTESPDRNVNVVRREMELFRWSKVTLKTCER